jgi:apolipoprotein N-acyltransferase
MAGRMSARRRDPVAGAALVGAGLLVAFSLPPWGWWPLAPIGIAILDRLLAGRPARSRFARGWLFAVGWLPLGMWWMWYLSAAGWIVASAAYAAYIGAACAVSPPGRWRRLALPAAITVAEAIRWSFPFGGVPLASLAISQVAGPLAPVVRVGGALLLTWLTLVVGVSLSALSERAFRPALAGLVAVLAVGLVAVTLAPTGHDVGHVRIAVVQGGGPQGTHALDSDAGVVFQRHLQATATLQPGQADLVVWPENVVDVHDFSTSEERTQVASEAARLGVPIAVGITEDAGPNHFTNAQVVVLPDGSLASRYDKVRIVPFGEWLPLRSLIDLVPGQRMDLVSRDAIAGHAPAVLASPVGTLGVMISWEVFFGGRARDAVVHGGQVLLNPTNGSSYTGGELQTQQIASSRLRALETGRWVVQVAPTGFSAFVTSTGDVRQRTAISEEAIRIDQVALRDGRTWYVDIGEKPVVAAALAVLGLALLLARRDQRRPAEPAPELHLEPNGDRTVVHELDGHLGAEAPRSHLGAPDP